MAFRVYTGTEVDAPHLNLDLGYRVTMDLMDSHLQRHHHVFADNFFTSVHLANDLLQAGTYLCGTTRATRREFPKTVAHAPLRPGESVKWTDESGVMVCKWKDKRDVYLIATNDAGGDVVKHVRRKHRDVDLTVPTCVLAYNKSMGGVDHLDQMRAYYEVGCTGQHWWKYLFWGLINVGLINAHILWKIANRPLPANARHFSLKSFKLRFVHDLGPRL